jgi:hypothetical protein
LKYLLTVLAVVVITTASTLLITAKTVYANFPIGNINLTVDTPKAGNRPRTNAISDSHNVTIIMDWSPNDDVFRDNEVYRVVATITALPGYTLIGTERVLVNDNQAIIVRNFGTHLIMLYDFPATGSAPLNEMLDELMAQLKTMEQGDQQRSQSLLLEMETLHTRHDHDTKIYTWCLAILTFNMALTVINLFAKPWGNH